MLLSTAMVATEADVVLSLFEIHEGFKDHPANKVDWHDEQEGTIRSRPLISVFRSRNYIMTVNRVAIPAQPGHSRYCKH